MYILIGYLLSDFSFISHQMIPVLNFFLIPSLDTFLSTLETEGLLFVSLSSAQHSGEMLLPKFFSSTLRWTWLTFQWNIQRTRKQRKNYVQKLFNSMSSLQY